MLKLEVSNMIKLPKNQIGKLEFKNYIYAKQGQIEEFVHNFWVDSEAYYFPRNIAKFINSWKGEELEFVYNLNDRKVDNPIQLNEGFALRDYQKEAMGKVLEAFSKGHTDILLQATTGFGKAQPYSSLVLTSDGWKHMGDLTTDDFVIGSDGLKKPILQIHEQGVREVYTVKFDNGAEVQCCLEHLWEVEIEGQIVVKPLEELITAIKYTDCKVRLPKVTHFEDEGIANRVEKFIELILADNRFYPETARAILPFEEETLELVRSLGFYAYVDEDKIIVVFDKDKVEIVSIVKEDYLEPMRCISVDSEDHLYITNDYILTHNTYTLSYLLSQLQQKTLILTDMVMLSNQMLNEIRANTNADIQIVDSKTTEVKDVNVVTYQLLGRNKRLIDLFKKEVGFVVADEIQNTGAESVKTIIQQFPAKYRLGLSATPTRSDGLTEVITDVYSYKVVGEGIALPVEVHFVKDMQNVLNPANYKRSLTLKIKQVYLPVIDLMISKLVGVLGKSVMIAVDSKEIQEELKRRYSKYGAEILNSETKAKERQQILEDYDTEKIKVLIGYKVLNKGISIPRMEVLINLFAATTKENIEQLIGRLMRSHPKKDKAVFVDFTWGLNMRRQFNVKRETYKKLKAEGKINTFSQYSLSKYISLLKTIKG